MRISDWSSDVCSSDLGQDPQPDASADHRIDPGPPEDLEEDGCDDDADRTERVRQDFEVGALDVEALLCALPEHGEGDAVHDEAEHRSEHRRVGKVCVSPFNFRWSPSP